VTVAGDAAVRSHDTRMVARNISGATFALAAAALSVGVADSIPKLTHSGAACGIHENAGALT